MNDDDDEEPVLRSSGLERIDTEVDPAPVEPVTLPSVPQQVRPRPGFEESQPSTSYNISASGEFMSRVERKNSRDQDVTPNPLVLLGFGDLRDVDECKEPERKRQKTGEYPSHDCHA